MRCGAPQTRQVHALLAGGQRALEQLLPGLPAELVASGAPLGDLLGDTQFWVSDALLRRGCSGMTAVTASMALLETSVRVSGW